MSPTIKLIQDTLAVLILIILEILYEIEEVINNGAVVSLNPYYTGNTL